MDETPQTTPPGPVPETPGAEAGARPAGLAAIPAFLRRTVLATRRRAIASGAALAGVLVLVVVLAVVLTHGGSKQQVVVVQGTPGVTHVPGGVDHGVAGSGQTDVALSKAYPRIYSPKLGVDVAIQPGDGKTPPVKPIAYQYPRTAPLGQPGNTYLYAHDRPGMFLGLHQAHVGDVLIVAMTPTDKLYFQVAEIHPAVAWNDLSWLQPTHDVRLTLQTCDYSGDYDPRYVIVTRPLDAAQGRALTGNA